MKGEFWPRPWETAGKAALATAISAGVGAILIGLSSCPRACCRAAQVLGLGAAVVALISAAVFFVAAIAAFSQVGSE